MRRLQRHGEPAIGSGAAARHGQERCVDHAMLDAALQHTVACRLRRIVGVDHGSTGRHQRAMGAPAECRAERGRVTALRPHSGKQKWLVGHQLAKPVDALGHRCSDDRAD